MRLHVYLSTGPRTNIHKVATWYAVPSHHINRKKGHVDDIELMKGMIDDINKVGRELLPDHYVATVLDEKIGRLEIRIRKGSTYQGLKHEFDAFKGFVECYGIALQALDPQ